MTSSRTAAFLAGMVSLPNSNKMPFLCDEDTNCYIMIK